MPGNMTNSMLCNIYVLFYVIKAFQQGWKIMVSNIHALWFHCSKFVNKTFSFNLSILVISTNSYSRYLGIENAMFQ